ncbi:MAG: phage integrase N-terminal SAM-like domain-containing protein [Verrucomicrobiae bacterium]|nr:phage integrase N-terminal SAM-like domain-containing protein [Verrucomicrobiae bacterium]
MNSGNENSEKGSLKKCLRETIFQKGYSYRTEQAYVMWYRQFVRFHQFQHPDTMGETKVTHLAVNRGVSPTTQNGAFSALLFLFRQVLGQELKGIDAKRAKRPQTLPTVLSREEVAALLGGMKGTTLLQARLLYGCGLRLNECLSLRIKDLDLGGEVVWVRAGKGKKDRCVELPQALRGALADLPNVPIYRLPRSPGRWGNPHRSPNTPVLYTTSPAGYSPNTG